MAVRIGYVITFVMIARETNEVSSAYFNNNKESRSAFLIGVCDSLAMHK